MHCRTNAVPGTCPAFLRLPSRSTCLTGRHFVYISSMFFKYDVLFNELGFNLSQVDAYILQYTGWLQLSMRVSAKTPIITTFNRPADSYKRSVRAAPPHSYISSSLNRPMSRRHMQICSTRTMHN